MNQLVKLLALITFLFVPFAAFADITVEDGGYTIYEAGGDYISRPNFRVTGTGPDAAAALTKSDIKSIQRHEEFKILLHRRTPKVVEKPVYIDRPVHHHHYITPTYVITPTRYSYYLDYPPPRDVIVDYIIDRREFCCRRGLRWYWYRSGWLHY